MSLIVPWLVFPLVLGLLALGCGLLLERLAGIELHPALVLPSGVAVVIAAAGFATQTDATAELAAPVAVALAVAGLALAFPWRTRRFDGWAAAAGVAAFAAFGAPIVLSGRATFAGFIRLDDTATWLAMTDRVLEHGRSLAGLAPSSYSATLGDYLAQGYPVGSFLPLGIGHELLGQDSAWLFQPYVAFLGAMLALGGYALLAPLVRSSPARAAAAFVAAQPALLYAYTLWGGVKEIAAAALLALTAALVAPVVKAAAPVRAALPLAVATAAVLDTLSLGGVVWLAPLLVPALAVIVVLRGTSTAARRAVAYAVFALALAVPALATASTFIRQAADSSVLTSKAELGNLYHPLSNLQFLGIWPTGDFRVDPRHLTVTRILLLVLVGAAIWGLVAAWRARAWELLLFVGGVTVGCFAVVAFGSPWVDGKALATGSPAPLLAAGAGVAVLLEGRWRPVAVALAVVIAGGVLWSNALAYHDVPLAPRDQLTELRSIGHQFRGQGPTLMTDFSPYGVRHFLRTMDAEGPGLRRVRVIPLRNGEQLPHTTSADIDDFALDAILVYRTLVLRRSPLASRPPSVYRLVREGRYYDVWQRPESGPSILEHLPLGSTHRPAGVPACSEVMRLARLARGGRLATVVRTNPVVVELSGTPYAPQTAYGEDTRTYYLRGKTTLPLEARVSRRGRYGVWLGGTFRSRLRIAVDGRTVAIRRHELNWPWQMTPFGSVDLVPGTHRITVDYHGPDLHPGSGGEPPTGTGPLVLGPTAADLPVTYVAPSRAQTLCGKSLDWIEAVSR
jgi:hypothetical protein